VIRDRVKREALMTGAEVAVRGGRTEIGDEILREILELELAGSDPRIVDLAERNQDAKNSSRYNRARAYELDRQLVSAAALYQSILDDEAGFGWEDVELRLSTISGRLAEAAAAYARAMDAEQAGDEEGYRAALAETVQASVDYADALARLRALHMEQAALESDS
jgi:sirohydrochlorin ferrochelatase